MERELVFALGIGWKVKLRKLKSTITIAALLAAASYSAFCAPAQAQVTVTRSLDQATYAQAGDAGVKLDGGQYLVEIHAGKNEANFVTAASTVLRANNARLIVQVCDSHFTVAVLAGSVIVKNEDERHVIELEAGTIYDCQRLNAQSLEQHQTAPSRYEQLGQNSGCLPLFRTAKYLTTVNNVSSAKLHASKFADLAGADEFATATQGTPKMRVMSPPTMLGYELGHAFVRSNQMPASLMQHFAPSGVISESSINLVAESSSEK